MRDMSKNTEKVPEVSILDTSEDNTIMSIPEIHWTQTKQWLGSQFCVKPEIGMLVDGGKYILRERKIRKLRTIVATEHYRVRYDRDYVVGWLAYEVIRPLMQLPYNDLQKLLSDAMKAAKAAQEHGIIKAKPYKGRSID